MARIRTIKPTFFRDHDISELTLTARLTFIGLWTYVDDEGRGIDDPRIVKGDLWLLDDKHTIKKVDDDLQLLADRGRIERYEVNGRRYLRVVNWKKHQRINRPSPSTIPAPLTESPVSDAGADTDGSRQEGKGREEEGSKEGNGDDPAPSGLGVVGCLDERFAREEEPAPAADGGAGPDERFLDQEQVQLNVDRARAAREALKAKVAS